MNELSTILLIAWGAGLAAFVGGALTLLDRSAESVGKQEWMHGVVALGGGILLGAVAFALVPEGIAQLSPWGLSLCMLGGGLVFCLVDVCLSRSGGSKAQFMAMLVDFVPEAMSMGAVFGHNRNLGYLLAAFIGAQNLPEGFNSLRELVKSGTSPRRAMGGLLTISLLGPLATAIGYFCLQERSQLTAGIMTFAGGGILYLVFQDIAPQAKLQRHWTPPLGAVLGFLIGALGLQFTG